MDQENDHMSMLSEILATKRTEIEWQRERVSLPELEEQLGSAPPTRGFRTALTAARGGGLIAEIKKASPSKGILCEDFDPLSIARIYAAHGATCLSVLTDERYFQGKLEYIRQIREIVPLPILRKDFVIDEYQILESRLAGADAILLIVAALSPQDLREFLRTARRCDLDAIVEVHDEAEMREAVDAGADIIGINNRNLHTFRTNIAVSVDLMATSPPPVGTLVVSESGVFTRQDVQALLRAGIHAVLVGEALVHSEDIGAKLTELLGADRSIEQSRTVVRSAR
jgi:indole-3-glycerol phosphate synthase